MTGSFFTLILFCGKTEERTCQRSKIDPESGLGRFVYSLPLACEYFPTHLSLLIATTIITLKLVVSTEGFCVTKTPETVGDARVLININWKI
jgi:hypothetical protein